MISLLVLWACVPKPVPPTEAPVDPTPPRTDGPVAGPRAIVEQELPPPPSPETPGGGPMNPYVVQVRKIVGDGMRDCVEGAMSLVTDAALVRATIAADGNLVDVVLDRSSGAELYDACVLDSFRDAKLPAPPTALLGETGTLATPQMAFR